MKSVKDARESDECKYSQYKKIAKKESEKSLTVTQLARQWTTRKENVQKLIELGHLACFDLSPVGPRRKYRITRQAVAEYEANHAPAPSVPRKKKRRQAPSAVKEFF